MREHTVKRIPATRSRIKLFSVAAFLAASLLFGNLARIAVLKHDYYTNLVFEEITTSSPLLAKRGTIYDCNMNVLATTGTVYRIFLSTKDVSLYEKKDGKDYGELIAKGLSEILKVDRDVLLSRIRNTKILDVTVKANASEEEYEKVLNFLAKEGLGKMVFAEAQSCREYPNATLAAHLLGFCGSENQGLYELEYSYNEVLSGKNGRYLYAKDANGYTLDTRYADYTPATDGASLVTTIDAYVQTRLEAVLEEVEDTYGVQNRVCGIVMDTKTGAILAMATSSPFNPNEPSELSDLFQKKLDESGLSPNTEEYAALKRYLREVMWSNKATDEIYEPGSTFKIVTVSAALDLGAVSENDRFSCHGYLDVGGRRIRCHKISGHGSGFTLAYGLQMSCNPTMMQVAAKIGASDFYDYVEKFGYFEDTGIDLPSEGNTVFHKKDAIGTTELATASFGQRFKVSVIGHLTAIAAVANGGYLVTPHIVDEVISADGTVISKADVSAKRQVISTEVANQVAKILTDGTDGDGGARAAGVDGYAVAAKTGTSQKFDILDANGNSYLRVSSTVAFAPSTEAGIAVILVADEPTSAVKYGSVVAAPYVSALLSDILPYLGCERRGDTDDKTVTDVVGMHVSSAKDVLEQEGFSARIVGDGAVVTLQVPAAGERVTSSLSEVLLYTENRAAETVRVPDVIGLSAVDANVKLADEGCNIRLLGLGGAPASGHATVAAQSPAADTEIQLGAVVTLTVVFPSEEEDE